MSDYDSSLPIKTENAGDVDVVISDSTVSSQKLKVNADGSLDVNAAIAFPAGSKIIITDGTEDLAINVDGSINTAKNDLAFAEDTVDVSGSDVTATVTATDLDIRPLVNTDVVTIEDGGGSITVDGTVAATQSGTWDVGTVTTVTGITNDVNIADGGNSITVDATALDIRPLTSADVVQANLFDEAGVAFSEANPLHVEVISDQHGDEVCDFNTSSAVAKNASVNHDYTVTAAKTFLSEQVWVSGSGKLKAEILINGAIVFVGFNSTSNPNIEIPMGKICKAGATEIVRVTITNRDQQAQDVYSTLTGLEV